MFFIFLCCLPYVVFSFCNFLQNFFVFAFSLLFIEKLFFIASPCFYFIFTSYLFFKVLTIFYSFSFISSYVISFSPLLSILFLFSEHRYFPFFCVVCNSHFKGLSMFSQYFFDKNYVCVFLYFAYINFTLTFFY